jgi:hypothetical protein
MPAARNAVERRARYRLALLEAWPEIRLSALGFEGLNCVV